MCLCVCGCTRMSGVVSAEKYLNIMEDFVVCLRLESLYMCARPLYMSESPPPLKIYRGSSHVVPTPTCLLEDTLARLCITNMRTLPQVSMCVIWRGITLWRDHTGDSFQLSKHHIKNTHALTDTHTHTYTHVALDTVCLPPSCVIEKSCRPLKLADIT